MGILEIIPKIPKMIYLINKTYNDILDKKPDLIISIDAPDLFLEYYKK